MANNFTGKRLASGQAAIGSAVIYTVPANTKTYVKSIICTNLNGSSQAINIFINDGTADRDISHNATVTTLTTIKPITHDSALILNSGDSIKISASLGTVDYVVSGVEET